MEWSQLQYFQTVARMEHFTRASELLMVSQPALSRSIANLEQELGTPLFDRQGRNVILNEYGKTFLAHVEKALRTIEEGKERIQEQLNLTSRSVRLAFLPTLGVSYVPTLIKDFTREQPDVQFHLWQYPNETVWVQLEHGEIDLGLCLMPPKSSNLEWQALFSEELYIIVPRGHRFASLNSIRLTDIAGEPFIGMKHGTGLRAVTDELFEQAGFAPHITFEGEEVPTIAGLVGAGLGVSLVPKSALGDLSAVRLLKVLEPVCQRTIGIAWVRQPGLSPAALRFREHTLQQTTETSG